MRAEAAQRKSPAGAGLSWRERPSELHRLHFVGLQAPLALHDLEGDLLAFLQGLEAGALDRAEMDADVRAAFRGDEAEALGVVEPLDGPGLTIRHVCYSWNSLKWKHDPRIRAATVEQGVTHTM